MTRAINLTLVLLAITAALPAAAQESGGLHVRTNPLATLNQIDADTSRGCALSSTSVTVGVNKAFGTGSSATQQLGTFAGPAGKSGCRPLVSTQVAAGVNLALGGGSQAGQSINVGIGHDNPRHRSVRIGTLANETEGRLRCAKVSRFSFSILLSCQAQPRC
jgi:hypothetical protein